MKPKSLLFLILGIGSAWLLVALVTRNFDSDNLFTLIIGAFAGYFVALNDKKIASQE
ncbi:hypothetical protein [Radiobacillus sp. PE A8.2]|uniref:hypothetical protein n=1 Tax=Radiobacillus sp. PE A8.2 TaxID=3380349 RepID=UPI003890966D